MKEKIREAFLSIYKDKIDEKEINKDYYNSFNKDQLLRLFKMNALIEDDNRLLTETLILSEKKKSEVVEELKKRDKKIYSNIIKCADETIIKQMEYYLKKYKEDILIIKENQLNVSLHFIDFLHGNCLAKVKYTKNKNIITFYTPKEIRDILKNIINNKKIRTICKKNTITYSNQKNIISAYGLLPLKEFKKIYEKIYSKITEDKLIDSIILNSTIYDDMKITQLEDDYLVYSPSYEDDEVLEIFHSLPDRINYKIFNKKEFQEIGEGTFHKNITEWYELINYLKEEVHLEEDELIDFDTDIILDYIYSYQKDEKIAKKNFKNNLPKYISNLKSKDKTYIMNQIEKIAKKYPNFNYKGFSYDEIKDIDL